MDMSSIAELAQRSLELLRRMTRDPSLVPPDAVVQPGQFLDPEIRRYAQGVGIDAAELMGSEPQSKRRKTGGPKILPKVTSLLWKLVGAESRDTLENYTTSLL